MKRVTFLLLARIVIILIVFSIVPLAYAYNSPGKSMGYVSDFAKTISPAGIENLNKTISDF